MTAQERAQLFDEIADAVEGRLTRHAASLLDKALAQEPGPARIVDSDACQRIAESLHRLPALACKLARDHAAAVRIAGQERAPQERLSRASDVLEVAQTLRRAAEALLDELEPTAEQHQELEAAVNTTLAQLVPLRELHPRAIRGAYELESGCLSAAARLLQTTRFTVWRIVGERAPAHRERQAQRKRALRQRGDAPTPREVELSGQVQELQRLLEDAQDRPLVLPSGRVVRPGAPAAPPSDEIPAGMAAAYPRLAKRLRDNRAVQAPPAAPPYDPTPKIARYGAGNGRKPPHWHQLRQVNDERGAKGLCGARPSYRSSATWEYAPAGQRPTCPTCLRIAAAGEEQPQEGATP